MCVSFLSCFYKRVQVLSQDKRNPSQTHNIRTQQKPLALYNDYCNHHKIGDVRQNLVDPKLGSKNEFHPQFFLSATSCHAFSCSSFLLARPKNGNSRF